MIGQIIIITILSILLIGSTCLIIKTHIYLNKKEHKKNKKTH